MSARRDRRDRGATIYYVMIFFTALAALAAVWNTSFRALQAHSGPSLERARARAVAEAAWARARRALERGREPAYEGPVLDGQASVTVDSLGPKSWRVEVRGRVPSRLNGGHVISRLILRVRLARGRVRILERSEVGA